MPIRSALKTLIPPLALDVYRAAKKAVVPAPLPEWSWLASWPPPSANTGWCHDSIVAAQIRKWPQFCAAVTAHGPLGVAHEAEEPHAEDVGAQNTILSFAYVLSRLGAGRSGLRLLDWGCGLGHYARFAEVLLPGVRCDYVGKDFPALIHAAAERNPAARFVSRDEDAFAERAELVFASGSLHYSQDWRATLAKLAQCALDSLYIARLPTVETVPSFVVVQRPHRWGYETEYHGWFINRAEFLSATKSLGFVLEREFLSHESPAVPAAPEQCKYRGFWFRRAEMSA
jgi:putative methyltransferase (TIGR04325 family)